MRILLIVRLLCRCTHILGQSALQGSVGHRRLWEVRSSVLEDKSEVRENSWKHLCGGL